jgi:hypothetical protein
VPRLQIEILLPGQDRDSDVRMALVRDRPLIVVDRLRAPGMPVLVRCADRSCATSSVLTLGASASTPALTAVGSDLAVVAFWRFTPGNRPGWRLLLLTCRMSGCGDVDQAPVLLSDGAGAGGLRASLAIAPAPGGGVVVADVSGPRGEIAPIRLVSGQVPARHRAARPARAAWV